MLKTIKNEVKNEIEVEKSKFITYLFPCNTLDEFNEKLELVKKEHLKARHHCYAYIINKDKRGNDDGEPKGSAGLPLLNGLEKKNLTNIAVIVVRYFGGTLLGSGRLLRTYVTSLEDAFKLVTLVELIEVYKRSVEISYDCFDIFQNYLKKLQYPIISKEFNDKINVSFLSPLDSEIDYQTIFLAKVKEIKKEVYIDRKEID